MIFGAEVSREIPIKYKNIIEKIFVLNNVSFVCLQLTFDVCYDIIFINKSIFPSFDVQGEHKYEQIIDKCIYINKIS